MSIWLPFEQQADHETDGDAAEGYSPCNPIGNNQPCQDRHHRQGRDSDDFQQQTLFLRL